jgi:hypothetical protein
MLDARFRPLPKWTRKPGLGGESSPFKTAYNRTLDKLEYELGKLCATDILIEAGFSLEALRNDGWPRGGTTPSHPGVVLYFKSPDGAMEFPCGTYTRFESNMHAIALTLENLRAIDRYGVTLGHQQYIGFASLPPAPEKWSVDQAADFIASVDPNGPKADALISQADTYRKAYRNAAQKLYPRTDADSSKNDGWYQLGLAKEILDKHHGLVIPQTVERTQPEG